METKEILGLTVLGAAVTTIGSLFAMYIKEFIAVRWIERRKAHQTLLEAYRRYQLPLFLAAKELSGRLYGLSREDVDRERERDVDLDLLTTPAPREQSVAVNTHYLRYRLSSNIYRLCSFLGWVELYRRDIGTLDVDSLEHSRELETCLANIRGALADGWINEHQSWADWRDCLIFREELRAIGHSMARQEQLAVLDFGSFTAALESDANGIGSARWFLQAALFFVNLKGKRDFRLVRMRMLVVFLTELMELLQPGRIDRSYLETASRYRLRLDEWTGGSGWRSPAPADPAHLSAARSDPTAVQ
ncbi:MAG: hypothetical protein ACJ8EB_00255 [Allosphingosinicella sp.]